jgi:hypothetical protein
VVFTALHTQYGLSLATVAVLLLGAGMGLLRRYFNTTTSTICHVAYDTLAGLDVTAAWLGWGVAAEIALLLVLVWVYVQHRRRTAAQPGKPP